MSLRFVVALLVALCGRFANAANPIPLSVEVEPESWQSRTSGPYPLHLKLRWSGQQLLSGQLRIEVHEGDQLLCTLFTDELVLNAGDTRSTWLIPAMGQYNGPEQLQLTMHWLQSGKSVWSASHPLRVPGEMRRTMVIGICAGLSHEVRQLQQQLALERLIRLPVNARKSPLMTLTPLLPPAELPVEPLQLCTYDVLLLDEGSVRVLTPPQRASVSSWVRAGGGLVITGGERRWGREDASFVIELFREHAAGIRHNSETGALACLADDATPAITADFGLGRVLLVLDYAGIESAPHVLQDAGRSMWRVRQDARRDAGRGGVPPGVRPPLHYMNRPDLRSLVDDLLPRGVEAVPLWLIAAVLVTYVVLIGPVDYLTLSALNRRKWTWVTFPLVTLGIAIASVWITRQYLKHHGPARSLVFRDVLSDGNVVRETQLAVQFELEATDSTAEISRGLCFSYGAVLVPNSRSMASTGFHPLQVSNLEQPRLEGRMPHAFKLRQELPERIPFTHRVLTMALPGDDAKPAGTFNWGQQSSLHSPDVPVLANEVRAAWGPKASAWVFHQWERWQIVGEISLFRPTVSGPFAGVGGGMAQVSMNPNGGHDEFLDLMASTTVRNQGLFEHVSQISPACDPAMEDLVLLDPADPDQAVLVIAVPHDTGWTVYRRRYHRQTDDVWK